MRASVATPTSSGVVPLHGNGRGDGNLDGDDHPRTQRCVRGYENQATATRVVSRFSHHGLRRAGDRIPGEGARLGRKASTSSEGGWGAALKTGGSLAACNRIHVPLGWDALCAGSEVSPEKRANGFETVDDRAGAVLQREHRLI